MSGYCISIARRTAVISTIALLASGCAVTPGGGWTPVQGSLYSPVQLFSEDTDVRGVRFNVIHGENASVYGLDLGAVGSATSMSGLQMNEIRNIAEDVSGVQLGILSNESTERVRGVQLAGGVNSAEGLSGVQTAAFYNKSTSVVGVQSGLVNATEELVGLQIGLFNHNEVEYVRGIQLAALANTAGSLSGVQNAVIYNRSTSVVGVQSALINRTERLAGLQIGLLNFNESGPLPFFPFVNFGFTSAP